MDKRYDHGTYEQIAQELWTREQIYAFQENSSEKPIFSIDTPPPTVSGTLHIGHIFSYTHADLIARYKRMRGYNVFYPMGFDNNGLPTERYVEKKRSTKASIIGRSAFIKMCLEEVEHSRVLFTDLWKRVGLSIDWTKTYSTISDPVRKISQHSFIELYKKGLAHRKEEPSLYCTTCQTSVAQAELDSKEIETTFNDLSFLDHTGNKLTIATTRPELLPACVALLYHPTDSRYHHLAGHCATVPIFGHQVPIISDDLVNPEKGSGLVMCCTFGDQTDVAWYKKHHLPIKQAIGRDGKWTATTGILADLRVHEARKKILSELQTAGLLVGQKKILHNVNIHERCKQEIEYLVLPQWFISILDHKEKFLELADSITWHPAFMKARYKDWVEDLHWDWCISRQRFFGIPFPVWHCVSCKTPTFPEYHHLPIDPQETACRASYCAQCGQTTFEPDTDVMDTWNTSALTPHINAHWPENDQGVTIPFSMRPQAHDIIRTWAFDTIVKSYYHNQTIPWENIVISGHVLSGKEKISKSLSNELLSPENLLKAYPADAIRFWAASSKLGTDTAFSENQLKVGSKLITKLWNALRFCQPILADYKPTPYEVSDTVNAWLLDGLNKTVKSYTDCFDQFNYGGALDTVEQFFWNMFCDNYLEIIKDQIFNPHNYCTATQMATSYTLYKTTFTLLQLYAPFVPFVTETLYQLIFKNHVKSVSIHSTIIQQCAHEFPEQKKNMGFVLAVIDHVRKLKSEQNVSLKTELKTLTIFTSCHASEELTQLIAGITNAREITFTQQSALSESLLEQRDDCWHATVILKDS